MARRLNLVSRHGLEQRVAYLFLGDVSRKAGAYFYALWLDRVPPRDLRAIFVDPDVRADIAAGAVTMIIPLVREARRSVKANLSLDAALLTWIDDTARRNHLTRSGLVEALARRHLAEFEV